MQVMTIGRLRRFAQKPWSYQRKTLLMKLWRKSPRVPVPIRLPFGAWWLAQQEHSSLLIIQSGYEPTETAFVQRILREGMVVLDVGANRGYYSLLASQLVGTHGRVIAFEPSPPDRKRLRLNLFLNHCRNVLVEPVALGYEPKRGSLFVVQGTSSGCHCLRSRADQFEGRFVPVEIHTLDDYSRMRSLSSVDLLKIDIEGGELDVFRGGINFLKRPPRPIVLCEIIDELVARWDYKSKDCIEFLLGLGFSWFDILPDGTLTEMPPNRLSFDGNYVAIPEERLQAARASKLI